MWVTFSIAYIYVHLAIHASVVNETHEVHTVTPVISEQPLLEITLRRNRTMMQKHHKTSNHIRSSLRRIITKTHVSIWFAADLNRS
jgi:hypothetical protein